MHNLPRSLRNNNPFNIKKSSSRWLGKVQGSDNVFETFDTLEHGLRAGIKLIINYVKNGYNTPYKIINRFAPSSENDSGAYLRFVCSHTGVSSDYVFTCYYDSLFVRFLYSIIIYESGLKESSLYPFICRSYVYSIICKFKLL